MIDRAEQQLHDELEESVRQALTANRPVLTHVNADTTWLIQLPYPPTERRRTGRYFYNILIDPWLKGPQSDVASWFSTQYHVIESSVQTIAELERNLKDTERLIARKARGHIKDATKASRSYIDVVAISHEFTDHCHQATLLEIDPRVPIFATEKAADLVRSWGHFSTVVTTPAFSRRQRDWRRTSQSPLPEWIGISRIVTEGNQLYYHSALCFAFEPTPSSANEKQEAEVILYSPHGINASDLEHLPEAIPPVRTLALLHGLHDVGISSWKQLNLGGHNGLRAQQACKAKYWVGTHDEVKKPGGLLAPFLRRSTITFQEAMEMARNGGQSKSSTVADLENVTFAELSSGLSLLLA